MTLLVFMNLVLYINNSGGKSRIEYSSIFSSFADISFHTSSFLSTSFFHFIIAQDDSTIIENSTFPHFEAELIRLNEIINPEFKSHRILLKQDNMNYELSELDQSEGVKFAKELVSFPDEYDESLKQKGLTLRHALGKLYDHIFMLTSAILRIMKLDRYISDSIIVFLSGANNNTDIKGILIDQTSQSLTLCLEKGFSHYMLQFISEINKTSNEQKRSDFLKRLINKEKNNISKNKGMAKLFASFKRSLLRYLRYENEEISKLYDLDKSFNDINHEFYNYTFTGMMFSLLRLISHKLKSVFKYVKEVTDMTNVLAVLNKAKLMMMGTIINNYRGMYKRIFVIVINKFQLYQLGRNVEIEIIRNLIKKNLKIVIKNIFRILKQKSAKDVIEVLNELNN